VIALCHKQAKAESLGLVTRHRHSGIIVIVCEAAFLLSCCCLWVTTVCRTKCRSVAAWGKTIRRCQCVATVLYEQLVPTGWENCFDAEVSDDQFLPVGPVCQCALYTNPGDPINSTGCDYTVHRINTLLEANVMPPITYKKSCKSFSTLCCNEITAMGRYRVDVSVRFHFKTLLDRRGSPVVKVIADMFLYLLSHSSLADCLRRGTGAQTNPNTVQNGTRSYKPHVTSEIFLPVWH